MNINISNDREELEKEADYGMMGLHATKMCSKFARKGDYEQARVNAKAWDNKLQKTSNNS